MILALGLAAVLGVTTLDGRAVDPFALRDGPSGLRRETAARALVFVFVRPDCPVSNRYVPELNRLHAAYHARGIRMYVVYAGAGEGRDALRAHHAEYGLRVPALVDPDLALAGASGATVTPEAAVFDRGPGGATLVYRGRIDDRAERPGVWRPVAATRDLDDVLARLARGEHAAPLRTRAYGCYLRSLSH